MATGDDNDDDNDGDGQRIVAVVLATLAQGHDELGGHEPRGVAAGGKDGANNLSRSRYYPFTTP